MKLDNPGLLEDLWEQIDEQLWHATERDGLHGIIADEEIRVAVGDRYVGSFSRNLGGVSLFDFGPASEDVPNQFHNWCGWTITRPKSVHPGASSHPSDLAYPSLSE